ncbi:hypothetical protein DV735_g1386, partial [Chaetothyriales sp. CBS 134920]
MLDSRVQSPDNDEHADDDFAIFLAMGVDAQGHTGIPYPKLARLAQGLLDTFDGVDLTDLADAGGEAQPDDIPMYVSNPPKRRDFWARIVDPERRRRRMGLKYPLELYAPSRLKQDVEQGTDTIYALSTAPGRAAIAVVRISGPACLEIYRRLCPGKPLPQPRTATLRKLYDPEQDAGDPPRVLDSGALVLFFPEPNTATGEPLVELHLHGGPAIVKSVLEAIPRSLSAGKRGRDAADSVIRPAEAGEFTMRAFYNGRLTLPQVEALGEALTAETEQQRRLAVLGAESGLAQRYEEWRQMLLYARGELEALIDFSEDQHFDESPTELIASTAKQVSDLERLISIHVHNASRGELLRNGISIALLGAPNAGKSSLLNRIVGREAAIVSAEAGTTRDIVDVNIDIDGWLCRIGDMAGLRRGPAASSGTFDREEVGLVEKEGIRRARERALQSDVVLVVIAIEPGSDGVPVLSINQELTEAVHECRTAGKQILFVLTKGDLVGDEALRSHMARLKALLDSEFAHTPDSNMGPGTRVPVFVVSCLEHDLIGSALDPGNIQAFLRGLTSVFQNLTASSTGSSSSLATPRDQSYWSASLSITHRQKTHLEQCLNHLCDFLAQSGSSSSIHSDECDDLIDDDQVDIVTAAEHLRYAASCLAKITGRGEGGDVEDVLGVVFEK